MLNGPQKFRTLKLNGKIIKLQIWDTGLLSHRTAQANHFTQLAKSVSETLRQVFIEEPMVLFLCMT